MQVTVSGVTHDSSGAPIGGALVAVWQLIAGEARLIGHLSTDDAGRIDGTLDIRDGRSWPPVLLGQVTVDGREWSSPSPPFAHFEETRRDPVARLDIVADRRAPEPAFRDEPTLSELGASIAAAVGRAQQEFARYPPPDGSFTFATVDLTVPASFSIDDLGRVRVSVEQGGSPAPGLLQWSVRASQQEKSGRTAQLIALDDLTAILSPSQVAELRALRVDDLQELAAVLARPRSRLTLQRLDLPVEAIAGVYTLLLEAGLPVPLGRACMNVGIMTVDAFTSRDPDELARLLAESGSGEVAPHDIDQWQRVARETVWGAPDDELR